MVGRPGNEAKCRQHGFCFQLLSVFQFPQIGLKVSLLLVMSVSNRLACISSNEQQEPIYYVYLKESCHLLSTYYRCLHKSSPPLELGDLYWQLKCSVARYELLLLRALKFQIQVQLPHTVSSQCLFMLACWSRVSCAQPSGPSDTTELNQALSLEWYEQWGRVKFNSIIMFCYTSWQCAQVIRCPGETRGTWV